MKTVIKAEKLRKSYRLAAEEIVALKGIDLEVKEGDYVSVMGPSGAGKTTLLNLIGCMDGASAGRLEVLGQDLTGLGEDELPAIRRGKIGFVFQEFFLITSLSALENVELAQTFGRVEADRDKAVQLLERVGLGHRLHHLPYELSGGEMQRVAIARALVVSPRIVLADEPTGNLDTKNTQVIFDLFKQFNAEQGVTVLVATHDLKYGSTAKRVVRLQDGNIQAAARAN